MRRRLGFVLYGLLILFAGLAPSEVLSCLAMVAAIIVWARLQGSGGTSM